MTLNPSLKDAFAHLNKNWKGFLDHWEQCCTQGGGGPQFAVAQLLEKIPPLEAADVDPLLSRLNQALYATYPHDNLNNAWWGWLQRDATAQGSVVNTPLGPIQLDAWGLKRHGQELHCAPITLPPIGPNPPNLELLHGVEQKIFLLADHWEHHNVVLAIVQNNLMQSQEKNEEKSFKLNQIIKRRDWLISWVFQSVLCVDHWLEAALPLSSVDKDLLEEWVACSALSMACQQKLFLPATVSRHVYSQSVLDTLFQWSEVRRRLVPDDMAFLMVHSLLSAVLKDQHDPLGHVLEILENTQFIAEKYNESFDFGIVLKAVCWLWDSTTHGVLAACYTLSTAPRLLGGTSSHMWFLNSLFELVQMPKTFPPYALPPNAGAFTWPTDLQQRAKAIIEKALHQPVFSSHEIGQDLKSYFSVILSRLNT